MARTLEFYFDYGRPYSHLADTQVEGIAKLDAQKIGNRIHDRDVKDRLGNARLPFVELA